MPVAVSGKFGIGSDRNYFSERNLGCSGNLDSEGTSGKVFDKR